MDRLSIIVPVFDEAKGIAAFLAALAPLRARGAEIIVADGGSHDGTADLARPLCDRVVSMRRGRAWQMNAAAAVAQGNILLFLHADTTLPPETIRLICDGQRESGRVWGRFDVRIEGRHWLLPLVAFTMNLRSRLTGIATGDQAMFVRRAAFAAAGGFPEIPLMEDVALSKRLKRITPPLCLRARVITSGQRWDKNGVWRTIVLMWGLRLGFFFGMKTERLAQAYGYAPREC